jgi:hypothetical protein
MATSAATKNDPTVDGQEPAVDEQGATLHDAKMLLNAQRVVPAMLCEHFCSMKKDQQTCIVKKVLVHGKAHGVDIESIDNRHGKPVCASFTKQEPLSGFNVLRIQHAYCDLPHHFKASRRCTQLGSYQALKVLMESANGGRVQTSR